MLGANSGIRSVSAMDDTIDGLINFFSTTLSACRSY